MVCKAASGSSKMRLRLEPWISLTWRSLISVVGSRARGRGKELDTISLDNFLKDRWCKSKETMVAELRKL